MMTEDKEFQRFAAENRDGTNVAERALRAGHSGGSPQGQNDPPLCNFFNRAMRDPCDGCPAWLDSIKHAA